LIPLGDTPVCRESWIPGATGGKPEPATGEKLKNTCLVFADE